MSCCRLIVAVALALPAVAQGQRAPVLGQVRTPHPYYFREMLIPQLTTGPSAVTWSPDGRELIYSMHGSLWRQPPEAPEAVQLTDGPGYDYQPDWSPDGRRVVYASYRNDAIELRLLDLTSGRSSPLVADGAVNIEPRWSPDGTRVVYTSSAHEGLWHVFIVKVGPEGAAGDPVRVTAERDSGLPRYYYHRKDQYFSPTWSPDGRELILLSNRGRIWGSGGFWRVQARPGGREREIHYEETTWKARPDWSPEGRRVVYSSYLGRQWNQLWLMTAEGGDPLQLTYGEFDATSPRWNRAGDRIAYISNQGGNTSLWVLELPAGARHEVRSQRRRHLRPTGRLRVLVAAAEGGDPLPARISVVGADGRSWAPADAWHHADDAFDRSRRRFEYGYFHGDGSSTLILPAGRYTVEISRGPEYRVVTRTAEVAAGGDTTLQVTLPVLDDLEARGWYSGDLHVHMNYGGTYRNDPRRLAFQARAEDLHVVENLIVNKEGRVPDVEWFRPDPDPASSPETLIMHGEEYHTSYWGHVGLLGLREHLILPAYTAYANTAVASLQPSNARVFDLARAQGAVTGYVHPYDVYPDPADTSRALTHALPVDAALAKVDYYEALGFVDDLTATATVWYRLLNCGFRLAAGAGTDAMANFASLRGPVGMNRVYVKSGALEHRRWLAALKQGRSFATNGPLLGLTVDGREVGSEIALPPGGRDVVVDVRLRSNVPVHHLELVMNGRVIRRLPITQAGRSATARMRVPVSRSGWLLLRARGDRPAYPTLDVHPYATTSPVYLTVGGTPARSAEDARYFIAWIDRMRASVEAHRDWNSEAERRETLAMLAQARAEYERRATE